MSNIVKTADGRITFLKSEFRSMNITPVNTWSNQPELILWTDTHKGGRCIKYDTYEEAVKVAKEIQEQL